MKKLSSLFKEVAIEHNISEAEVKQISDHFFSSIAEEIRSLSGRSILIHNFGSLKISPKKYRNIMLAYIKKYKKGLIEEEEFRIKFAEMMKIRKTLMDNVHSSSKK